jgi:hypothetical protein
MIGKKLLFRTLFALLLLAGLLGAVIVPSFASVGHMPQLANNLKATRTTKPTKTPTLTPTATGTATNTPTATSTPLQSSTPCSGGYSSLSLVINEVGWMGTEASSNDEWVELYNPTACSIPLSGWTFTIQDTSIDINLTGTINAHGYFLLVQNDSLFKNIASYNYKVYPNLSLTNDGESLVLQDPNGAQIDTANWWDGYWPAGIASDSNSTRAYSSMERYYPPGGPISSDSPSAWVTFAGTTTSTPLDRNNNHVHGTPGYQNWAASVTETPTPKPTSTRAPTPTLGPTPVPAVVINEILPRPGSDWNGDGQINNGDEFIEVENLGPGIATLTNWTLQVTPNNGNGSYTIPTLQLPPNGRAVFFGSKTQLLLQDSGETVTLKNTSGVIEDAFTYPPAFQPDDSWCRMRDGIGPWQDGCFPTPGTENSLSGRSPIAPPTQPGQLPPCDMPDTAPIEFRLGECYSPGGGIYNPDYWNETPEPYWIPDPNSKLPTYIQ